METPIELCQYCTGVPVPVKYCTVALHIELRAPELCRYCQNDTPLTQCEVQEHWEARLRTHNLPQSSSVDGVPQVQMRVDGVKLERLVPLTGSHENLVDRTQLPAGWHTPSSGPVEFRKGTTTYRDINIFERCASPRYNSAGFQIGVSR